ncbi:MAG: hypothetical protein R6V62_11150 [Candidatus Fermentibacteraceae bacterium]
MKISAASNAARDSKDEVCPDRRPAGKSAKADISPTAATMRASDTSTSEKPVRAARRGGSG